MVDYLTREPGEPTQEIIDAGVEAYRDSQYPDSEAWTTSQMIRFVWLAMYDAFIKQNADEIERLRNQRDAAIASAEGLADELINLRDKYAPREDEAP